MYQKLQKIRAEKEAGERGFTLIELLVVVVIIGILVAIAIPLYLSYRQGAENKSVESDIRNAVPSIEQYYADATPNAYPAALNQGSTVTGDLEVHTSSGNTLTYVNYNSSPASFCVSGTNSDTNKTYHYTNSSTLDTADSGRVSTGGCPVGP